MPVYMKSAEYDKMSHQISKIMSFLSLSTVLAAVYILIAGYYELPCWTIVLAVTIIVLSLPILLIYAFFILRKSFKIK